jgi:hypothetical protein
VSGRCATYLDLVAVTLELELVQQGRTTIADSLCAGISLLQSSNKGSAVLASGLSLLVQLLNLLGDGVLMNGAKSE